MESENVKIEDSTTTTTTTASNNGDTSGDTTTTASNNGDTSGDTGSSTTTTTASTVKDENVENDAKPPPELVKNKGQLAQEKHSEEYNSLCFNQENHSTDYLFHKKLNYKLIPSKACHIKVLRPHLL